MSNSITDFITTFSGGTRLNRFKINGKIGSTSPSSLEDGGGVFYIRAASIPDSNIGAIAVNYRGRTVAFPGDRAYKPWNIVILDENPKENSNFNLHKRFHEWHDRMSGNESNLSDQSNPLLHFSNQSPIYGSQWSVEQLDTNGPTVIRKFELHNCWPAFVGPIELDMGKDNTIASFMVTIVYSHYTYVPLTIGNNT